MYLICFQVSVTSHYCLRVKRIQSVSRFLSPVSYRQSVLQLGCVPVLMTLAAWLPSAGVIYAMLCSPSSSSPCPVVAGTRSHAQSSLDPHRRLWALRRNHTKEENRWQQNHWACQLLGMKMIVMGISCLWSLCARKHAELWMMMMMLKMAAVQWHLSLQEPTQPAKARDKMEWSSVPIDCLWYIYTCMKVCWVFLVICMPCSSNVWRWECMWGLLMH